MALWWLFAILPSSLPFFIPSSFPFSFPFLCFYHPSKYIVVRSSIHSYWQIIFLELFYGTIMFGFVNTVHLQFNSFLDNLNFIIKLIF